MYRLSLATRVLLSLILALSFTTLALTVPAAAAASNDDFDNATEIAALPFTVTEDVTGATAALDDPYGCSNNYATVWFRITPTVNELIALSTTDWPYGTAISVWTGARGALSRVACNQWTYPPRSTISFSALAGETYYIMLSGTYYYPTPWSYNLTASVAEPPANDDIYHAAVVGGLPFSDVRDTRFAANESWSMCGPSDASVWYAFTPTTDVRLQIDTTASSYWAMPYVFAGSPEALTTISCGRSSLLRVDLLAGVTYYIEIGSWSYAGGELSVRLDVAPPLAITLAVDSFGKVDPTTGVAEISGTVTCNQTAIFWGSGFAQQRIGNGSLSAYIMSLSGMCYAGTPGVWHATLDVYARDKTGSGRAATLFTAGPLSVQLSATGLNPSTFESSYSSVARVVTLRGGQ